MQLDLTEKLEKLCSIQDEIQTTRENPLIWEPYTADLKLRLSWNSNALEGNTLSLDETIAVIEYDEVRSGHTYTEYREAKNMYRAINERLDFSGQKRINLAWLSKVNALILQNDGAFRQKDVYIGTLAEAIYYPPAYQKVPELMGEFERRLQTEQDSIPHILPSLAKIHMDFERIHPFPDGNGRTGRTLLNQQLLNYGLLPAVIKNQSKYRQAFRHYDRSADITLMESVIADGILESYRIVHEIKAKYLEQYE